MEIKTEYFTVSNLTNTDFFMIPKTLFVKPYHKISNDSKILYSIMLGRTHLSLKNGYIDNGKVFIYFTQKEIMKALNCWENKATKVIKELQQNNLLEIKREGFASPNKFFLKQVVLYGTDVVLEI